MSDGDTVRSGHLAERRPRGDPGAVLRRPRDLAPGIQHAGAGAAAGSVYFLDDRDRAVWLQLFVATVTRFGWRCIAVCLLTTHWHAILHIPDDSLARGMHQLVGRYSKRFNERHLRAGYLVRGRYWSRRKDSPPALLEAYRYVARNPVAAGLADRPEDWRWSSYGTTIGVSEMFAFVDAREVLAEFGTRQSTQIQRLRRFVDLD